MTPKLAPQPGVRVIGVNVRNNTTTEHNSGFTLIEVLVAVGIIAGIVTFAAITLNNTNQGVRQSSHQQHAQEQANNALENVRAVINNDGTICDAPPPTTSSHAGQTFTTTTTLQHVRSTDTTQGTFDAVSTVSCADAQAVRVNVLVTWDENNAPGARHELNSSISLVSLNAPEMLAFSFEPPVVAQGDTITARWDEGDTLPIPRYTLVHPTSPTEHMGAPSTVPPVTWTGPDPWVGEPATRTGTIRTDYGDDPSNPEVLTLEVTRDRINTLQYSAQRSGTQTIQAQNITDSSSTSTIQGDITVVMQPSFTITPNPPEIQYGNYPSFTITPPGESGGFYTGGHDEDYSFTLTGTNNTFTRTWSDIEPPTLINLEAYQSDFPPPTTFPATYNARIDNVYTDFHGHEPGTNYANVDVQCLPPRILEFIQGPTEVAANGVYNMYIRVHPENVPDGRITIVQNGSTLNFDPPLSDGPARPYIVIPPGTPNPIEIEFPYFAGPQGTDTLVITASSATCNSETSTITRSITVVEDYPDVGSYTPNATCSISAKVTLINDTTAQLVVTRSYATFEGSFGASHAFPINYGGSNRPVRYPIRAEATGNYIISPSKETETFSISAPAGGGTVTGTISTVLEQEFVYKGYQAAHGNDVVDFRPPLIGNTVTLVTCIATDKYSVDFPVPEPDPDPDPNPGDGSGGGGSPDPDPNPGTGGGGGGGSAPAPDPNPGGGGGGGGGDGEYTPDPGTGGGGGGGGTPPPDPNPNPGPPPCNGGAMCLNSQQTPTQPLRVP